MGLIKEILGWRRRRRARKAAGVAEAAGPIVEVDVAEVEVKSEIMTESVQDVPVAESLRDSPPTRSLRSRKKIIE